MAASNRSSAALSVSMDVPQKQNTAPVLEFRCLFTSDLRRKQKRWQDGRLKFHTFNKRAMVYDDRSNFVGDTHWRKDYEFNEGEVLELDRGGFLVEVGECIGKRDQDLTELIDNRVKEREGRVAAKNVAMPRRPQASFIVPRIPAGSALLRPKSLNAVLGNPTGFYGKAAILNQSPFEQRQQTMRDENENDRSAKRRKQDNTLSSKSGYAQNLMGTKLTLASSRPRSTADIIYEHLQPTIQRPPAATIDLTVGEKDHRTTDEERKATLREEMVSSKCRRPRTHKTPPSRRGYVSSLIGVSLNLKRPETSSSKGSVDGLSAEKNGFNKYQIQETGPSPSFEPDSLIDAKVHEERPRKRLQTQEEPAKKKPKPSGTNPATSDRPSSPPVMRRPAASKPCTTLESSIIRDYPGSRVMANRPISTLKIKSRAPRKMMMLMERPVSRSLLPKDPSDTSQTGSKHRDPKPCLNIVPSHSTMRVDMFPEHQEQRLKECLNGMRAKSYSGDISSSPIDNRISHQMIDSLLSRRTTPPEPAVLDAQSEIQHIKPAETSARDHEDGSNAQGGLSKPNVKSTEAVANSNAAILNTPKGYCLQSNTNDQTDVQGESPTNNPSASKVLPMPNIPSTDATDNTAPTQFEPVTAETFGDAGIMKSGADFVTHKTGLSRYAESLQVRNISTEKRASSRRLESSQSHKPSSNNGSPDRISKRTSRESHAPVTSRPAEVNKATSPVNRLGVAIYKEVATAPGSETDLHVTIDCVAVRPKAVSTPPRIGSAIVTATPLFGAMIKSSASIPKKNIQDLPQAPLDQLASLPKASVPEAQKNESASSDVFIASPKPSLPLAGVSSSMAKKNTNSTRCTAKSVNPTVLQARKDQPKAMLINPATGGPSVQMTARRSLNALVVPAFNTLPNIAPPPPRVFTRPRILLAQDEGLANQTMREPVKEVTPGGPWSRESFDLFGSWRPPGRSRDTNAVNS